MFGDTNRFRSCPGRQRAGLLSICIAGLVCSGPWMAGAVRAESVTLVPGPGSDLTTASCAVCHSLDYIVDNGPVMTPERWQVSVRKMIDVMGAPITAPTRDAILAYLSRNYVAPSTK